ncbi:MAG: S41 family peptidase [Methyloceanibacter sp.]
MRKSEAWMLFGLAMLAAGSTAVGIARSQTASTANPEIYRELDVFGEVLERVRADYVDKPDDSKLIESAIDGMLSALDPHSSYMDAKEFRDMQVQTRGEFGGLGLEVSMENGVVKVVSPIADTPAARAGLQSGDLITALDKTQLQGLTLQEAVEKMRGPVHAPITLTIVRKGVDKPFEVTMVRDVIHIRPVKYSAENDVGYIQITSFNEQTTGDLEDAVKHLKKEIGPNLKGYLLDLRNNPGGLLDQAISVSDDFLDEGAIVITKSRNLEETQRTNARLGDITDGKKLVVLINGGSASASEIVAGALQDHRRATIVGTRSFGKGSVQTIIPLGSNGALRLTTARYYTPSGRSIQAKGIEPDTVVQEDLPADVKSADVSGESEASLRGHLKGDDDGGDEGTGSSSYVAAEKNKDNQFQFGLDLLRGVRSPNAEAKQLQKKS